MSISQTLQFNGLITPLEGMLPREHRMVDAGSPSELR